MADATPPTGFFSKPPQPRPPVTPPPAPGTPPPAPGPPPLTPPPPWADVSPAGPTAGETTEPHPWTRYFARSLDILVGGFVLGFILGLVAPSVLRLPNAALGFLILVVWIFVETGLLATWGTTPGKWL